MGYFRPKNTTAVTARVVLMLLLFGFLYLWNSLLSKNSAIVIYFGRPSDILIYVRHSGWNLFMSGLWCVGVAICSLILSGALAVVLLIVGLCSNRGLTAIERGAAAFQTVPILVIVVISEIVEQQVFKLLNVAPSSDWYCLIPVVISLMFPPLANGAGAISRTPIQIKAMLRLWDAQRFRRIRHVYLPLALPDILTGLRASATWAVGATLIAEGLVNGVARDSSTLGHFLLHPFYNVTPGRTPSVILLAIALGYLVYILFAQFQRFAHARLHGRAATAEEAYPLQSHRRTPAVRFQRAPE